MLRKHEKIQENITINEGFRGKIMRPYGPMGKLVKIGHLD